MLWANWAYDFPSTLFTAYSHKCYIATYTLFTLTNWVIILEFTLSQDQGYLIFTLELQTLLFTQFSSTQHVFLKIEKVFKNECLSKNNGSASFLINEMNFIQKTSHFRGYAVPLGFIMSL